MSRLGLTLTSAYLTPALMRQASDAIVQTRDGQLRAAVPRPIGTCFFVNDLGPDELVDTLAVHNEVCRTYPRGGDGQDAFVR